MYLSGRKQLLDCQIYDRIMIYKNDDIHSCYVSTMIACDITQVYCNEDIDK